MTLRRVLVTGATGFVGRHALPALVRQGFEVHGAARTWPAPVQDGVTPHQVDLLVAGAAAGLVQRVRPSHLLHLAWTVVPGQFWRTPDNLDWVAASLALYRAFAAAGGRRAVVAGSCAEYDWGFSPLDEATTPCRPATLYGVAKNALHDVLRRAATRDHLELAWARLFFLYGPHEPAGRLVPEVAVSFLRRQPVACGDGVARRDFMHVEDAADALARVLASDHVGPVNIASGTCVPVGEVISTLARILDGSALLRMGTRPAVAGEPAELAAGMAILRDRLHVRPARTLADGLAQTAAWWRRREGTGRQTKEGLLF